MTGQAMNRVHDFEAGMLTLLGNMLVATEEAEKKAGYRVSRSRDL